MTTAEDVIKLRTLVDEDKILMVTTRSHPEGELHGRPLTLCEIDDEGALWFLVDAMAPWLGSTADDAVNVALVNDDRKVWLSIAGDASIVDDRARVHRLWSPYAQAFFPGGVDDPAVRLLKIRPTSVEYWDGRTSGVTRLVLFAQALLHRRPPSNALGESGVIELN
ncbi:MAG: pyridoxamine 5'-phosphate oxidase family protein [Acidimicrobiia bacterium]